jgi:hypothetical protein
MKGRARRTALFSQAGEGVAVLTIVDVSAIGGPRRLTV